MSPEPPKSALSYSFRVIDVFAERPFAGKPTAVFTDARGLSAPQMGAIAEELRFPQTAFVFPPNHEGAQAFVRVFTPTAELPRAEHLTIAAVYALGVEDRIQRTPERLVLEEQGGPVSVYFRAQVITVRQKVPVMGSFHREPNAVAATLGLQLVDLQPCIPQAVSSSGVAFLLVAVKDPLRLESARFRMDIWERTIKGFEAPNVVAFALLGGAPWTVKARAFLPALGVMEDPATEGAAGPLVAYAIAQGLMAPPAQVVVGVEQGAEIGRPSVIQVFVEHEAGVVHDVRVGGQCQLVGEGTLLAPRSV